MRGINRTATVRVSSDKCELIELTDASLANVLKYHSESYHQIQLESARRFDMIEKRQHAPKSSSRQHKTSVFTKTISNFTKVFSKRKPSISSSDPSIVAVVPILVQRKVSINETTKSQQSIPEAASQLKAKSLLKRTLVATLDAFASHELSAKQSNKLEDEATIISSSDTKLGRKISYKSDIRKSPSTISASSSVSNETKEKLFDNMYILFVISQHLDIKDRISLRQVCHKWNIELQSRFYWEKIDFFTMSNVLNQSILKMFCENVGDSLQTLILKNCFKIGDTELKGISLTCKNIGVLSISNCWKVTDRGISYIAKNLVNIWALDVSYCSSLTGAGLVDHQWNSLENLDLSYLKQIQDLDIERIVTRAPEIRRMHLRRCKKISDIGIYHIVKICRNIEYLDLTDCDHLTEKAFKWIVTGCTELKTLDLTFCTRVILNNILPNWSNNSISNIKFTQCNQLSRESILHLFNCAHSVRYISLRGINKVDDFYIAKIIQSNPHLYSVNVTGCLEISDTLKTSLKKAKYNTEIVTDDIALRNLMIEKRKKAVDVAKEVSIKERYMNVPRLK